MSMVQAAGGVMGWGIIIQHILGQNLRSSFVLLQEIQIDTYLLKYESFSIISGYRLFDRSATGTGILVFVL